MAEPDAGAVVETDSPEDPGSCGIAPVLPEETDDDSLIRWMLSLTPTQRLEVAQGFVDSVEAIRDGQPTA